MRIKRRKRIDFWINQGRKNRAQPKPFKTEVTAGNQGVEGFD
jgi:hypothetical protein